MAGGYVRFKYKNSGLTLYCLVKKIIFTKFIQLTLNIAPIQNGVYVRLEI